MMEVVRVDNFEKASLFRFRSMTGCRPRLQSPSVWPVDFDELLRFTLSDSLAQEFVHSSCNRFFEPNDEQPARVRIRRGAGGSWAVLPRDWQQYFEAITDPEERERVLVQLSTGGQDLVSSSSFLRVHGRGEKAYRGLRLGRRTLPNPWQTT